MKPSCRKCGVVLIRGINCYISSHVWLCKTHEAEASRSRYRANRGKRLKNVKEYYSTDKGRRIARDAQSKTRSKYPERYRARAITTKAIRHGVLVRLPCEVCAETPTHAHHDDYNKPLEVRWLCVSHHEALHHKTNV